MSIYYKYAPDGFKLVVLSHFDYRVYWYTSEELVNWFVDKLANIFHVNFIGYENWSRSIRISQLKDHYILVYQDRYDKSVVVKYPYTATIKENSKFHKTTLPHDRILTKEGANTSDKQVKVLSIE